jgi:tetratricopeptide (TPR) repeat protein
VTKIRQFALFALVATLCASAVGQAPTASELLQKGIYLEETVGNLDEAIRVYKQVVQTVAVSRVNAAQAEYRMGICLQKKGRATEAIATFQKLVREYPEQVEIVAQAREFLPMDSKLLDKNANPCQYLENQMPGDSGDVALREKTIACYWDAQVRAIFSSEKGKELERRRVEHVLWMIQHFPDRDSAGDGPASAMASSENYIRIRHEWMSQVQAHSSDVNVLANAAHFMDSSDVDKAEELASRAHTLDPKNVRAARFLAEVYERKMHRANPELRIQLAQQALQLREQSWNPTEPAPGYSAVRELQQLAKDAFEAGDNTKARKYAEDLSRRDDGDGIHQGNLMLGRLALKNGNVEEAKSRLLAAGKTLGSPSLGSFGPNMMLASELLQRGQREVVIQYFDECEEFWKTGGNKLDEWRQAVRQGRIPNFGANLIY